MKRILSVLVILMTLFSMISPSALADGEAKRAIDSSSILYNDLKLIPANNAQVLQGTVNWSCSIHLGIDAYDDFVSLFNGRFRYKKVWVTLYSIDNIGDRYEEEIQVLHSKDYNKKDVKFSGSGTIKLSPGHYRIKVETNWDKDWMHFDVCQHDFTVISSPTTKPSQYATVKIVHELTNGTVIRTSSTQTTTGYQTFYPTLNDSSYELISNSSVRINVTASGNNTVYFTYRKKTTSAPATPTRKPVTPTPKPVTPTPFVYDSSRPFISGIQRYDYCTAPEYYVSSSKPQGYCFLYSKASDQKGENLGKYKNGEVVKVIEYYGGSHGKYNYCYVITQDNKLGYIHDYALTPAGDSPFSTFENCTSPVYYVYSTKPNGYCFLYSEASDQRGENLGKYNNYELVKVIEYYGGSHGKYNYCYVITHDNKLGYIHDYSLVPAN